MKVAGMNYGPLILIIIIIIFMKETIYYQNYVYNTKNYMSFSHTHQMAWLISQIKSNLKQ